MSKDATKLPLELGIEFMVEMAGITRTSYQLIGSLEDQYLILKQEGQVIQSAMINLKPGTQLVVRYISKGKIIGFRSSILVHTTVPDKLVFIKYPKEFAVHNVRSSPRIDCLLPAKLVSSNKSLVGTIVDMSFSGCSWRSSNITYQSKNEYDFSESLKLIINFPGVSEPVSINCKYKNTTQDNELMCLGLEFLELGNTDNKILVDYLHLGFVDERILSSKE